MSLPTVIVGSVLSDAASETQPDSRPAVSMVKSARAHLTRLCLFIPMMVSSPSYSLSVPQIGTIHSSLYTLPHSCTTEISAVGADPKMQ